MRQRTRVPVTCKQTQPISFGEADHRALKAITSWEHETEQGDARAKRGLHGKAPSWNQVAKRRRKLTRRLECTLPDGRTVTALIRYYHTTSVTTTRVDFPDGHRVWLPAQWGWHVHCEPDWSLLDETPAADMFTSPHTETPS